ncbi:efflux RND transporter periplasmic adaptor subunit [Argonema antarcticum]|uniref:efflux RND transporter periplasmic adaptor subunit n=1 Tax=Argonema antarcticum TaxID=2942763 RepID=UPI0020115D17|nr:efflux RND transporter periplasmic adaptor subunit [Argonema antarcticum]MCL1473676.1 efflux RND transporter periplasmic adaptor subunit [Argonema antarcticum A004/B2]
MIPNSYRFQRSTARLCVSGTILSLILLTAPTAVLAHGGHGDEFQGGSEATESSGSIQVDAETAKRLLIQVEPAKSQQLAIGIKTTGQIETLPSQKVEVTAPIPGKVVELLVEPGTSVKAGQPVAVVSAPELVELRAQSSLEVAKSRIGLSNTTYQTRLQQLGTKANDKGLVTVTAPISGKVADREVTLGQSFQDAGGKLMTIVNDSRVFATANIYEKDLNKVQIGQRVRVKIASLGDRNFEGKITRIGSLVNGETRVVPVQAELNNPDGELKPGLFAELEVITDRTANAILAIPSSAVVDANGKKVVYVQNGNAFQAVDVTLGQTSGDLVEVKSGLFEGDSIVTQRAPQLYAQSLRGGSKPKEGEAKEAHSETTDVKTNNLPLPMWLMGVVGGTALVTVASVAFWAGRRTRFRTVAAGHPEYENMDYEIEPFLNNHKQPTFSQSVALIEERENPHKPN